MMIGPCKIEVKKNINSIVKTGLVNQAMGMLSVGVWYP